jgi:hypothetical protein
MIIYVVFLQLFAARALSISFPVIGVACCREFNYSPYKAHTNFLSATSEYVLPSQQTFVGRMSAII